MLKYIIKNLILITIISSNLIADKGDFEKVSLQLQWKHQFQFAGYYIAKEKGFYKEEGLKVDIKEFYHGISPYDVVVSNEATYGTG
ncbi:MAG: ABC transporter substrate-binding protein, partial [Campylobacterota bacterium]|nr:ABC transporter substrate-binding protein [Campylobacterota bacterium]